MANTSENMEAILRMCNLSHLLKKFHEQKITPGIVGRLKKDDLVELGIRLTVGDRIRLQQLCEEADQMMEPGRQKEADQMREPGGQKEADQLMEPGRQKEVDQLMEPGRQKDAHDEAEKGTTSTLQVMKRLTTSTSPSKTSAKKSKQSPDKSHRMVHVGFKIRSNGKWTQIKSNRTTKWTNFEAIMKLDTPLKEVFLKASDHYFPNGENEKYGSLTKYVATLRRFDTEERSLDGNVRDLHLQKTGIIRLYFHIEERVMDLHDDYEELEGVSTEIPEQYVSDDSDDLPEIQHTPRPTERHTERHYSETQHSSGEQKEIKFLQTRIKKLLDNVVGMKALKDQITQFAMTSAVEGMRRRQGLTTTIKRPVMVFSGNPGTGKTSVAEIVAEIMMLTGLVEEKTLTTVQRGDLVATHIGETAMKTKGVIRSSSGGTLLIDEAYRLSSLKDSKDFGQEAIETIMEAIEGGLDTTTTRPAIIFAGYPAEMENFIKSNAGLARRITHTFVFPDYTTGEIVDIFTIMSHHQGFTCKASKAMMSALIREQGLDTSKFNAGYSCKLFLESKAQLDARIFQRVSNGVHMHPTELMSIEPEDVERAILNLKL